MLRGQKAMCAEPDNRSPITPVHWILREPNVPSATRYKWKSKSKSLDIVSSRSMDRPKQQYVSGADLHKKKKNGHVSDGRQRDSRKTSDSLSLFVRAQHGVFEHHRYVVLVGGRHLITLHPSQTLPVLLQGRVHDERRPDRRHHPVHGPSAQTHARHHFTAGPHHRVQLDRLSAHAGGADGADLFPRPRVPV